MEESRGRHLAYVDGLRALAAAYVVFHHAALIVAVRNASMPIVLRWIVQLLKYGHSAVALFIVLSGFCLMMPVTQHGALRGGAPAFLRKRARRILPPYLFALGCSLLLNLSVKPEGHSLLAGADSVSAKDILTHLFLLQDLFADEAAKINVVLWSVAVEWRISLIFPFILWIWKRWGAWRALMLFLVTSYLGQYLLRYTPFNRYGWGVCVHFVGLFCLGMMACEFAFSQTKEFVRLRDRMPWKIVTPVALLAAILVLSEVRGLPFYVSDFFVGLWVCCLLVSLSGEMNSLSLRFLSWRPLVFAGTFAYSIYLIHSPILQIVFRYLIQPLPLAASHRMVLNLIVGPFCSLVAAYLFFLGCERPFLGRKTPPAPFAG